jgi:hypothetical protein
MAESEIAALGDFLRRQYFETSSSRPTARTSSRPCPTTRQASGFIDWNDDKLRVAAELVITRARPASRACSGACRSATPAPAS